MKKRFLVRLISLFSIFSFISCNNIFKIAQKASINNNNYNSHCYYEEDVGIITNIKKSAWYGSSFHYKIILTVYNERYDIEETFDESRAGAYAYSLEKDDEVNITLVVNPNTNSAYISSINY